MESREKVKKPNEYDLICYQKILKVRTDLNCIFVQSASNAIPAV